MTDEQESQQNTVEAEDFPSLHVALEELRRKYDTEQDRKSNIEVKIGAIIGIDAILISVVSGVGQLHWVTAIGVLLPALLSAGFALKAFNSREYKQPGPKVDEIFGYAGQEEATAQKNFIQNYRQAINHNARQNNRRIDTLNTCFLLTAGSFVLVLGSPLIDPIIRSVVAHFVYLRPPNAGNTHV